MLRGRARRRRADDARPTTSRRTCAPRERWSAEAAARGSGARRAARELRLPAPRGAAGALRPAARRRDRRRRSASWARAASASGCSAAASRRRPSGERVHNTSVLLSPDGELAAVYRKIHLFDVDLSAQGGSSTASRRASRPARRWWWPKTPFGGIGLSVCYDLRFPELYRAQSARGARFLRCRPPSPRDRARPLGGAAARARDREPVLRARARAVRAPQPRAREPRARPDRGPLGRGARAWPRTGRAWCVAECDLGSAGQRPRRAARPAPPPALDGTLDADRWNAAPMEIPGVSGRCPSAQSPLALRIQNGGFEGMAFELEARRDADRPQPHHRHHAARRGHQPRARPHPLRRRERQLQPRGPAVDQRDQGERQAGALRHAAERRRGAGGPDLVRLPTRSGVIGITSRSPASSDVPLRRSLTTRGEHARTTTSTGSDGRAALWLGPARRARGVRCGF